jgi:N-acetylneuraminic acid mutarotase
VYNSDTYVFSMSTGQWRKLTFAGQSTANGTLPVGRWYTIFEALSDTKLVLYGGEAKASNIGDVWIFDVSDETWHPVTTTPTYVRAVANGCSINGKLVVVHGEVFDCLFVVPNCTPHC